MQADYDGSVDAFGLKLDPSKDGAAGIDYFTYLGTDGMQVAYAVDVDKSGNMYLAGYSSYAILANLGGPARADPGREHGRFCGGLRRGFLHACRDHFRDSRTSKTAALACVAASLMSCIHR